MSADANWWWRTADPVDPGDCAIFDMDGVISDAAERQHLLMAGNRDWGRFFAAAGSDSLFPDATTLLELLGATMQIVLVTARPVSIRDATVTWLDHHHVPYDLLVMRPDDDRGTSRTYKHASLHDLRAFGFTPRIAFEDDIRNVEMFRNEGLPCVYIHSGYYE